MNNVITVSQLNRYVKSVLEGDAKLKSLYVRGEISNFTNHLRSGHCYFTLKEGGAAVKCVLFASYAQRLLFHPENGMAVIARCGVSLFERDGAYQLYVQDMQPEGIGALTLAFNQLKEKLAAEGLFSLERKRPLPRYPERVALVTSKTGAALQDMLSILGERYPLCSVRLYDAAVQGISAVPSLIAALQAVEREGADVVIIGRGGGSMEDLWAFNDESLARQVAGMSMPVISAVGHETDFTICDFAADVRAETPSAAAQMAVPDGEEVLWRLESLSRQIESQMCQRLDRLGRRVESLGTLCRLHGPERTLQQYELTLDMLSQRVEKAMGQKLAEKEQALGRTAKTLELQNPLKLLSLGYTITTGRQGGRLKSLREVSPGDVIRTRMADGWVISQVTGKEKLGGKKEKQHEKNNDI